MNGLMSRLLAVLAASALIAGLALVAGAFEPVESARADATQSGTPAGEPKKPKNENNGSPENPGNGNGGGQSDPQPEHGNEPDQAHQPNGLSEPHTPERGESVNAKPERGTVKVKLPGQSEPLPLSEASSLPVGSIVDARSGAVKVVAAASPEGGTQWAIFSGAVFKIVQRRTAGVTEIRLVGRTIAPCPARASVFKSLQSPLASASSARRPVRRLWATGKGRFSTHGKDSVATVRGTTWMTADTCRGTIVRVRHGVVDVRDLIRNRTVVVRTGQQYLAKKRP